MTKVGRPTKDTPQVRAKIEEAAALDASVEEIAFYADISRETYYEILKKDPEFSDRIGKLRQRPILAARQTVIKKMTESYQNAIDYLKRKKKLEFGDSSEVTVNLPQPILGNVLSHDSNEEDSETKKED
jgi:predicted DNA-binding protein YlxM (UPF0122 family)